MLKILAKLFIKDTITNKGYYTRRLRMEEFEKLLEKVNLRQYREMYRNIKIVEMDLPKNIQALFLLYDVYWNKKIYISFEEFYKKYSEKYSSEIEAFREKTTMCKTCFYKGLPARIYRTWASIITQIHAGYVAEAVFGKNTVEMSEELDHKGIDFKVDYKGVVLNYQIKKQTFSREVRKEKKSGKSIEGEFIELKYDVPSGEYFENPKTKKGELRLPYKRFIENKNLKRLENGFVLFTKKPFISKKKEIDV